MRSDSETRSRPRADETARSELGKNIERIRTRRGMSRSDLADQLHMTLGGVSAWEYGRTRPDIDSLKRLCSALDVSADELLGERESALRLSEEETKLILCLRDLPEKEKGYLMGIIQLMRGESAQQRKVVPLRKERPSRGLIRLTVNPLSMCAGDGFDLTDGGEAETIRLIRCDILEQCDELVRVSGSSMEPEYSDGDLAIVEHTEHLEEGDIGVFVIDGEGMIKQYRKDGLYPLNPDYSSIKPGEYTSVRCFGRVLGKVTASMRP